MQRLKSLPSLVPYLLLFFSSLSLFHIAAAIFTSSLLLTFFASDLDRKMTLFFFLTITAYTLILFKYIALLTLTFSSLGSWVVPMIIIVSSNLIKLVIMNILEEASKFLFKKAATENELKNMRIEIAKLRGQDDRISAKKSEFLFKTQTAENELNDMRIKIATLRGQDDSFLMEVRNKVDILGARMDQYDKTLEHSDIDDNSSVSSSESEDITDFRENVPTGDTEPETGKTSLHDSPVGSTTNESSQSRVSALTIQNLTKHNTI